MGSRAKGRYAAVRDVTGISPAGANTTSARPMGETEGILVAPLYELIRN